MKILLITLEYPPQKGGVASYYAGLMESLREQGHNVSIISQNLLFKRIWPRWLKTYFVLRAAIKREKPDIVFVGHLLPLGTAAWFLRKKIPYAVFLHGMDILLAQKSRRKKWLAKKILQNAKFIVVNSEFTKISYTASLRGAAGDEAISNKNGIATLSASWRVARNDKKSVPVVVVYPCPNIKTAIASEQVDSLRRKLGLSGKKIILTLGRVVERKGHDVVIKAMPELLQHIPEAVYIIAGDGPDMQQVQKLASHTPSPQGGEGRGEGGNNLRPYVRFVGQISNEERAAYYALCDLFVMPSRQIGPDVEGFGLSFIEAALFGKPSIGGKSGGIPEAILDNQTGIIVEPTDVPGLARAAVQLLRDDQLRHELGQNAKARAIHEFNWKKQTEKLPELLY